MQSAQQPNLAAGFKNNIGPIGPQVQMPTMQQIQQMQQMQQMQNPQIQHPQMQQIPQDIIPTQTIVNQIAGVADIDTISIFGQVFQKKYFYLFLVLIFATVGYFIWKWYSGKKKNDDESEEEDDEDFENEQIMQGYPGPMGQLGNNQQLMNQMLQQQMMAQRKSGNNQQMNQQQNEEIEDDE